MPSTVSSVGSICQLSLAFARDFHKPILVAFLSHRTSSWTARGLLRHLRDSYYSPARDISVRHISGAITSINHLLAPTGVGRIINFRPHGRACYKIQLSNPHTGRVFRVIDTGVDNGLIGSRTPRARRRVASRTGSSQPSTNIPQKYQYLLDLVDDSMTFGVEFELASQVTRSDLCSQMQSGANLRDGVKWTDGCHGDDYESWWIQYDGTITRAPRYRHRAEIATPILKGKDGLRELFKFIEYVKSTKIAKVTRNCGGHIHIGGFGTDLNVAKKVFTIYKNNERLFDKLVPNARKSGGNQWMSSIRHYDFERMLRGKYYKLSFRNFEENGTFENRHQKALLNFEELATWIILNQFVVRYAQKLERNSRSSEKGLLSFIVKIGSLLDLDSDSLLESIAVMSRKNAA